MLTIRALLRTAAKLGAALHHPQELIELGAEMPSSSAMTNSTSVR